MGAPLRYAGLKQRVRASRRNQDRRARRGKRIGINRSFPPLKNEHLFRIHLSRGSGKQIFPWGHDKRNRWRGKERFSLYPRGVRRRRN